MELVDLILTVCLISNPERCRLEHLYFESRGTLFQCMVLAPAEIAKWASSHPSHQVVRWKCAFPAKGRAI